MATSFPLGNASASASCAPEAEALSTKGRIHYLCLQATREGQASHAHVHEIIKGLERRGWQVQLFEPSYAGDHRRVGTMRKLLEFMRLQLRVWKTSPAPDVFYARDHVGLLPSYFWARFRRVPVIAEINGSFADYTVAYPWMRMIRLLIVGAGRMCLRLSSGVIAVTPLLCDWVRSQVGPKPVFLVPNGANTELFRPDATSDERIAGPYVVFFGAFAPWQGIDTMLRAAEHPEWPSQVKLVLIGSGQEQAKVERAAAQNPHIVYLGRKPYRAVPGIVAGALAGISAQTNPGGRTNYGLYPLKVFETLACGVPIIVTDFAGQRELVQKNRCGLVIPQGDAGALAQSLASLVNDEGERVAMGQRGREVVENAYSWQHSADTTASAIRQILTR